MRFAWLRENSEDTEPAQAGLFSRAIFVIYNLVWWLPMVLGFTKVIEYRTGLIMLLVITIVRAIANVIRTNFLTLEQAEVFPFRAP
jgi:hypothetical protein